MRSIFLCGFFVFFILTAIAENNSMDKQCLIISGQKELLNIWKNDFGKYKVECSLTGNVSALDGNTDLSKYKYMIIETPRVKETFARNLENWVKQGGILIASGIPSEYLRISFSGETVPTETYNIPFVASGKAGNRRNAILRANSVVDYGNGTVVDINIPDDSELCPYAGSERSFTVNDKGIRSKGLALVTGWPDRALGDMSLVKARLDDKEKGVTEQTVISRHRYGRGLGIAYMLPVSGKEKTFDVIRAAVVDYAVNFKASDKKVSPYSVEGAPGKAVEDKEKSKETAPERPAPPANCILELQGDTFTGSAGSPSWAPWRIALSNQAEFPIERTFKLEGGVSALWLKVKAAYGDHTDAPLVEVKFNGHTLVKAVSPWMRIQYNPDYYDRMFPVWIYVPSEIVKEENSISFINHGPDWWLLDYVQFYKAEASDSLESWQAKAVPGRYEARAVDGEINLDGKLDDDVWKKVGWKNFDENECGASPTSFALVNGNENLFIAFKCPYDKKSQLAAEDNVVEFAASWPGCETSYIFSYKCNGPTSLVSTDGDVITGSTHKAAFADDKEKKLITVEMAVPWTYLSVDFQSQVYYPSLKRFMPEKGVMSINAFRRIKIGPRCVWTAWLPFAYQNKNINVMSREYLTRVPYHLMYKSASKGWAIGLGGGTDMVKWPFSWKWGLNELSITDVSAMKEVQVRHEGDAVFNGSFSGRDLEVPLVLAGESDVIVKASGRDGALLGLSMRPASIEFPCMAMAGKSFYTTEKTAEVVFKIHDIKQFGKQVDRIDAEMILPGGRMLRSSLEKAEIPASKYIRLPFDISSLDCGSYKVKLSIAAAGETINLAPLVIRKLAPSESTEVKLRFDGTPEINGKPFFPFGICFTAFPMHDSVKTVSDAGINVVIPWDNYSFMDKAKWDKFCGDALKEKVFIILRDNAGGWLTDYDRNEKFVKSMKDYKAVFGYYPIDEPEYWHAPSCTPQKLKEFNDFRQKVDPYRPNMISHAVGNIHYGKSEGMVFNDAVDIRIWECYAGPAHIIKRMDEMAGTGKNDRIVSWAFLRTGPGHNYGGQSPRKFRANAYAAIIAGCRGILYFEMRTSRWTGHELWPDVFKKVSDEVQTIAASLIKETSREVELEVLEGAPFSRAKAWIDGDDIYLMAVNANEKADQLKVKFPFDVEGNGKALFEEMPDAAISGSTVTIKIDPDGIGVYKLEKD